ncbi:hypothetical protein C4564_02485 [Candidatus Microgenomates bacterium]|nr:MAG: hypothetical protein C4564_02485 [Candidatus Microgenomates bacterium]
MKKYDPQLCLDAEILYKKGEFDDALQIALEACKLAEAEAHDRWEETKKISTPLSQMTKVWDTTSQKYVSHSEFLQSHSWKDDIAPGPFNIACKCLRAKGKLALKSDDLLTAKECFEGINKLGLSTERDILYLNKINSKLNKLDTTTK